MAKNAPSEAVQPVEVKPASTYDGAHAAVILIERVLAYAYADGIANVTVAAHRVFPDATGQMAADVVVTAYLKLTLKGAKQLQAALRNALLLSQKAEGARTSREPSRFRPPF
jgi:hypothetical protein